jgi:hypothetical protein
VSRPSPEPTRPPAPWRRWLARLLVAGAVLVGLAPAAAAWAVDKPNSLTIVGEGISAPITIRADTRPDLYTAVLRQVNWMAGRPGDFTKPNLKTLGPKYTITLFNKGVAAQVCDVYPEAAGGPRAHWPKTQPRGKSAEAWFYATVTLPGVLRAAGVPLPEPSASGQAAGMGYEDPQLQPDDIGASSGFSLGKELGQARLAFAATAATAVLVLLMLFGAAQLSRRRWSR